MMGDERNLLAGVVEDMKKNNDKALEKYQDEMKRLYDGIEIEDFKWELREPHLYAPSDMPEMENALVLYGEGTYQGTKYAAYQIVSRGFPKIVSDDFLSDMALRDVKHQVLKQRGRYDG